MRYFNGGVDETLDLADQLTVNGSVTGPVHVHDGGHLIVNGMLSGDVRIDEGSFVTVNGQFAAEVMANNGLIIVSGLLATKPSDISGRLAVAIDSNVVGQRLMPDGSLAEPGVGDQKFETHADQLCAWDEGRFVPMPLGSR